MIYRHSEYFYSFFSGGRHCPATLSHATDLENTARLQKTAQMLLVFHHKGVDEHPFAYIFVAVINKSQQQSPQALLSAIRQMLNVFFFPRLPHLWPFVVSTSVDLTIPPWTPEMTVRRARRPHQIAKKLKVQQHYPSSFGHTMQMCLIGSGAFTVPICQVCACGCILFALPAENQVCHSEAVMSRC